MLPFMELRSGEGRESIGEGEEDEKNQESLSCFQIEKVGGKRYHLLESEKNGKEMINDPYSEFSNQFKT